MSSHFSTGWQPVEQPEHPFISRVRLTRAGVSLERDPLLASITPAVSDSYIDEVLSQLASQGNSERPIASRFQSFPENVKRLVQDDESLTVKAARTGVAYAFTSRPQQFKRPRPLKLQYEEQEAVSKEIERLLNHCQISSRDGARPRQLQGVTVPLDGLRARGPPGGSLATRGPRFHLPLDRSSQTIQPPPTSDSTGEHI